MMKAYGYSKGNNSILLELSECTLECTVDELEKIILFLERYKKDLENGMKNELWTDDQEFIVHRHYDCNSGNEFCDLIIASRVKGRNTGDGTVIDKN